MQTRDRLARMARFDNERFVARFSWPGLLGIFLDHAWSGVRLLGDAPAVARGPIAVLVVCGALVLFFLHPLAVLSIVLALFRRGRTRWLVILPNVTFLLTTVLILSRGGIA